MEILFYHWNSKMNYLSRLIIASHNSHKIDEMRKILKDFPTQIFSLRDINWKDPHLENGRTYYENALQKVRSVVDHFGEPALGEDSGLEVDALGGIPGMYSARYGGPGASDKDNNCKLLKALQGIPFDKRTARYRCTLVLLFPKGDVYTWEGTCEGIITLEPKGFEGFGYDPLFFLPEYKKTFAELGLEIKNKISHRAQSLAKLREFFQNYH